MPANRIACWVVLATTALLPLNTYAAEDATKVDQQKYDQAVQKGIAFLKANGQAEDGSYSGFAGSGVTSLVTLSLLEQGLTPQDPTIAKSLAYLEGNVQPDGGIYAPKSRFRNYETCLAVLCLAKANSGGKYDKIIAGADKFIKGLQWDEGEDKDESDVGYGGGGYGGKSRPDLSNTAFLIESLRAAGNDEDNEAIKRALIFVSRCQNLETEHNTTKFAAKNPDGGFYYTPVGDGDSEAGETPNGGLRSYGAMTYAGLKSMIYAGVTADDPRVKAAVTWIGKNYDLDKNPGVGDAGLYYYYHLFAKALAAADQDTITDESGEKHNWRAELAAELFERQHDNGSWTNDNSKWLEGDPNLCTGYALLALSYCKP